MAAREKPTKDHPDNRGYSNWTDGELWTKYQELAILAADCVVMHGCDPGEQDWYRDLEDLFIELAYREDPDQI